MKHYTYICLLLLFLASGCKNDNVAIDPLPEKPTLKEDPKAQEITALVEDKSHVDKIKEEAQLDTPPEAKTESKVDKIADAAVPPPPAEKPKKKKAPKTVGKIEFKEVVYDYGKIDSGDEIEHNFIFTNVGKAPLNIITASATCGCTVPSYPFLPIEPGQEGRIGVYFNSVGKEGIEEPVITITSDGNPKIVKLKLKGEVLPKKKEKSKQEEPTDSIH